MVKGVSHTTHAACPTCSNLQVSGVFGSNEGGKHDKKLPFRVKVNFSDKLGTSETITYHESLDMARATACGFKRAVIQIRKTWDDPPEQKKTGKPRRPDRWYFSVSFRLKSIYEETGERIVEAETLEEAVTSYRQEEPRKKVIIVKVERLAKVVSKR